MRQGILVAFSAALLFALFASTHWIGIDHYGWLVTTRLIVTVLLVVSTGALMLRGVVRNSKLGAPRRNAATLGFALLVMFLLFEAGFLFVGRSHAIEKSLAARVWQHKHWNPINEAGYRGALPSGELLRTKETVFVVGDSFTAGYGIEDINDRFSNVAASLLPDPFLVMNLGIKGSDLRHAITRIEKNRILPRTVVYQYSVNDIHGAALALGQRLEYEPYNDLPSLVKPLVNNSFLLNFLYWWAPRSFGDYEGFYTAAFANPRIRAQHLAELDRLITFLRARQVDLVVVLFPDLVDLERNRFALETVRTHLSRNGIPVVEVEELVDDLSVRERIVNSSDSHPSVEVHHRAGRRLADVLKERGRRKPEADPTRGAPHGTTVGDPR